MYYIFHGNFNFGQLFMEKKITAKHFPVRHSFHGTVRTISFMEQYGRTVGVPLLETFFKTTYINPSKNTGNYVNGQYKIFMQICTLGRIISLRIHTISEMTHGNFVHLYQQLHYLYIHLYICTMYINILGLNT